MRRIVQAFRAPRSLLAVAIAGMLAASPAIAASPKVEAAIKSLAKIETDAGKFQSFCKLIADLDDVPDQDVAKAEALERQLENVLRSMGFDVLQAWDLGGDLDPQSEDGKAFEAAIEAIEDKCP